MNAIPSRSTAPLKFFLLVFGGRKLCLDTEMANGALLLVSVRANRPSRVFRPDVDASRGFRLCDLSTLFSTLNRGL
jgi:hypothetical protein